jgi:hypothetical protein
VGLILYLEDTGTFFAVIRSTVLAVNVVRMQMLVLALITDAGLGVDHRRSDMKWYCS